mgnify:CR=1 FL=1
MADKTIRELFVKECLEAGLNFDDGHVNYIDDSFSNVLEVVEKVVQEMRFHA